MKITSIDVGFVNTGIAVLEGTEEDGVVRIRLISWTILDCDTSDVCEIAQILPEKLSDEMFHDVDEVIIEQQFHGVKGSSAQNTKAMMIAHMILQFFVDHKYFRKSENPSSVKFVSAQAKFGLCTFPSGPVEYKTYKNKKDTRKDISRQLGKAYVKEFEDKKFYQFLHNLDKQDDVCDAYIQGRSYLEKTLYSTKFYNAHRAKWDAKKGVLTNCPSNITFVSASARKRKRAESDDEDKICIPCPKYTEEEKQKKLEEWKTLVYHKKAI